MYIQSNGTLYEVIYTGLTGGKAKLWIDGLDMKVSPVSLRDRDRFFRHFAGDSEIILYLEQGGADAQLTVDGVYYGSDQPVDDDILRTLRARADVGYPPPKMLQNAIIALLLFIVVTYLHTALFLAGLPLVSAFCLRLPIQLLERFYHLSLVHGERIWFVVGAATALLCTTGYLVVYVFAHRYTPALAAALVLVLLDTALILFERPGSGFFLILGIICRIGIVIRIFIVLHARMRAERENACPDEIA